MPLRLASALVLLGLAAPAAGQPVRLAADARPAAGTLSARPGALAALDLTVRPGVPNPIADCAGEIEPAAPDVALTWAGGPLRLTTRSAADLVLLVRLPDGSWRCDDDTDGLQPVVSLPDAPRGRYAVWVGGFGFPERPSATLYAGLEPPAALGTSARPRGGEVRLAAGFEAARGAHAVSVPAGVTNPARAFGEDCAGFVEAAAPSLRLVYAASAEPRPLYVAARAAPAAGGTPDLVLLARLPSGEVRCNDDALGTDPGLAFEDPAPGTYAFWVGSLLSTSRTERPAASLVLSEEAPEGFRADGGDVEIGAPLPFSEGAYVPFDPEAPPAHVFQLDGPEARLAVMAQGEIPNPVSGDACRGLLPLRPTADLRYGGGARLSVYARAEADLVLLVRAPDGRWLCSDDASGSDPGVEFDAPEAGLYRVWLGTFGGGEDVPATLIADENALDVNPMWPGGPGVFFSEAAYAGTSLRPDEPEAALRLDARTYRVSADVLAGGPLANPAEGPGCVGALPARPQLSLAHQGGGPLALVARAEADLVLLVRAPDGRWFCSDDAEGANPAVEFEDAPEGPYALWVGTYAPDAGRVPASVEVRRGQLDD